ncbi:MAG: extracellular solute-binding protein [Candidatus Omnitrophota bacterium]|jgi:ABC-type glycerol-3-phosphate transport system substrate-binding protein
MMRFILILLTVVLSGIAGCAPSAVETKGAERILVWHWMTDREEAFDELARRYKSLTGINVQFELYAPTDAYDEKIKGAAQTQTLPDIFGVLADKRVIASFINAGHILNLEPYMEQDNRKWENTFYETALNVNRFLDNNEFAVVPGVYAAPIDVMNIQMVYNKDLFKKAGLDPDNPPKNWAEFLAVGNKLNAAGIQGMVSGWGEIWMIDCLASNYAYNIMGEEKFIKTLTGEIAYTDPDWIKVFGLFKDMRDNNLLASGIVTMVNKHAEQMFANQRAALAFNGSWCVNVYHGMNPGLNYGAMLPPAYSDKYPMMIWGGAGASFMINARSAHKEKVVDFLKWLTAKDQQAYLSAQTRNLPANKDSLGAIPEVLAQFVDDMDLVNHPNNLNVSEFPRVIEARSKGIQSVIIGEKTPEEVALEVQSVKLRELQKSQSRD